VALAVLILSILATTPSPAGPNAGGMLVVHDTGLEWTSDQVAYPSPVPYCSAVDNRIDLDVHRVWKVYAAFLEQASPRLKALSWGTASSSNLVILAAGLPGANDFEITQGSWPTTGSIGMSFFEVQTASMIECYWFGGYAYGSAQAFATVPHAVQNSVFVDDSTPAHEDTIAEFSWLGFGQAGNTNCPASGGGACCLPEGGCVFSTYEWCLESGGAFCGGPCTPILCPTVPLAGACCIQSECQVMIEVSCVVAGGVYQGDWVHCTPGLCEVIPSRSSSWGRIKVMNLGRR
jgi:hypothetical protein